MEESTSAEAEETEEVDWSGHSSVVTLFITGAFTIVIGAALMGGNWPSVSVGEFTGDVYAEGSVPGVIFGALVAACGQILVLVGAIACGVRIGNKP